jgi:hypothetical protein
VNSQDIPQYAQLLAQQFRSEDRIEVALPRVCDPRQHTAKASQILPHFAVPLVTLDPMQENRYCVTLATGKGFANCFRFSSIQLAARRSASAISSRLISLASFFLSLRLISIT